VSTQLTTGVAVDAVEDAVAAVGAVDAVVVDEDADDVFVEPPPQAVATAPRPKVPSNPRARRRSMCSVMVAQPRTDV
jgi:hypothetical protein